MLDEQRAKVGDAPSPARTHRELESQDLTRRDGACVLLERFPRRHRRGCLLRVVGFRRLGKIGQYAFLAVAHEGSKQLVERDAERTRSEVERSRAVAPE